MKTFRIFVALLFCIGFIGASTSCLVLSKKDNGAHKGWYKMPNHPNHQNQNKKDKPAKSKGKTKEMVVGGLGNVFVYETQFHWSTDVF